MKSIFRIGLACLALADVGAPLAAAQYDLSWYTIDGGGAMFTAGGNFELSGTIGQPDAGLAMTGGGFELLGGFWAGVAPFAKGDMNCDGRLTFSDINPFVLAISDPDEYKRRYPDCYIMNADCNGDGRINFADINPFVDLLSGR